MKTYYILSQDARQLHCSRYEAGGKIQYESARRPIDAASPQKWLDADWLRALRQQFSGVSPEGWLVAYPFCASPAGYGRQLETALEAADFENPRAVADVDAVRSFYEPHLLQGEPGSGYTRTLTLMMSPAETGILISAAEHHRAFRLRTPSGVSDSAISDFFASLYRQFPSVELCLMAGESPVRHMLVEEIKRRYNCPVLDGADMDKAVHTGLERLAPALVLAGGLERRWCGARYGAEQLAGALYRQYHQVILAPLRDMLKVSVLFDRSLALWKSGFLRSKALAGYTAKQMEKGYYESYPDEMRLRLRSSLQEYSDAVNSIFSQTERDLGRNSECVRISPPEEETLWPSVSAYFCYETKDALDRACASIDGLYLPDHAGLLDLASGHRIRLFHNEAEQLEKQRQVCDYIAGENFAWHFSPTKKRALCLFFIRTVLADSQAQILRCLSSLLDIRSIEYCRLSALLEQVDESALLAALDEIEKGGALPGSLSARKSDAGNKPSNKAGL